MLNNQITIFNMKAAHTVWLSILLAHAALVVFYGSVEAASFPEGQQLTYFEGGLVPDQNPDLGSFNAAEQAVPDWKDQLVEFFAFVSSKMEAMAEEHSEDEDNNIYDHILHNRLWPLIENDIVYQTSANKTTASGPGNGSQNRMTFVWLRMLGFRWVEIARRNEMKRLIVAKNITGERRQVVGRRTLT